jgi:triosephosphate isomerase
MMKRKPLIAGNWKMNLDLDQSIQLINSIAPTSNDIKDVDVLVAPPFTALAVVKKAIGSSRISLGAQNMHWETEGAFTGEVSGKMLLEGGCTHVILGHSERRSIFKETSQMIDRKVKTAVSIGLIPILCVGETLEEREAGDTFQVIRSQLDDSLENFRNKGQMPTSTILAYEPVWAIGTGKTATPEQAQEVHQFIREWLADIFGIQTAGQVRILYGGSVKPENVSELMSKEDIDGALVGGASLKAASFNRLIRFEKR